MTSGSAGFVHTSLETGGTMKRLVSFLLAVGLLGVAGVSAHSALVTEHAPGSIAAATVPVALPALQEVDGAALYAQQCATCHGKEGKGDGAAAAALDPKPRDFSDAEWQKSKTDEQLTEGITNGVGTLMPPYKQFSEQQVKALVTFIRTLDDAK